jgi:hypothetical protein
MIQDTMQLFIAPIPLPAAVDQQGPMSAAAMGQLHASFGGVEVPAVLIDTNLVCTLPRADQPGVVQLFLTLGGSGPPVSNQVLFKYLGDVPATEQLRQQVSSGAPAWKPPLLPQQHQQQQQQQQGQGQGQGQLAGGQQQGQQPAAQQRLATPRDESVGGDVAGGRLRCLLACCPVFVRRVAGLWLPIAACREMAGEI